MDNDDQKLLSPGGVFSEELLEYVYSILEIYDEKAAREKGSND